MLHSWLIVVAVVFGGTGTLAACDIELHATAVVTSGLIHLRDIATVHGLDAADRQALEQLAIAPAPTPSGSRAITATQLRYWLEQHGVETAQCRMTGATHVTVYGRPSGASSAAATGRQSRPIAAGTTASHSLTFVKQHLARAVRQQLATGGVQTAEWSVDVDLPRRALWSLPAQWTRIRVEGLNDAQPGKHQVTASFESAGGVARIPVTIDLAPAERVVVAVRPLSRGQVIGADDVEVRRLESTPISPSAATDLKQVIGREAKQMIAAGHIVDTAAIRLPRVVHRRDVVDVISRTEGIVVRRRAIATQDGSVGDVIVLQSINDYRERFSACVTGPRTASIFVGVPTVLPTRGSQK